MWHRDKWWWPHGQKFNSYLEGGWFSPARFQIRTRGENLKFDCNPRSSNPNGDFISSSDLSLLHICYIFLQWVCSLLDIDECSEVHAVKMNKCHPNASCINTQGSYNCCCNPTYIGDGFKCGGMFGFWRRLIFHFVAQVECNSKFRRLDLWSAKHTEEALFHAPPYTNTNQLLITDNFRSFLHHYCTTGILLHIILNAYV